VVNADTADEITISWLIGADDRWYAPEREITTRQHLIRNTPIVATSVRIPSGDAIATHFGAVQSLRELSVIDIENRSKVPFVCALMLRGPGVQDVTLQGNVLKVGGFPLLHLSKPPTKVACVPRGDDLEQLVVSGNAAAVMPMNTGPCEAAVLFPVTHGTTVRSAVLLGVGNVAALAGTPVLSALGEVHTLANGWQVQLKRTAVLQIPHGEVTKRFDAATAALLLAAEPAIAGGERVGAAEVATLADTLASAGFLAEAGALLEDLPQRQTLRGAIADSQNDPDVELQSALSIQALANYALVSGDRVFAETMVAPVAGAAEFVLKRAAKNGSKEPVASLWWAAALFDVAGDHSAAKQVRKHWLAADRPWPMPRAPLPQLPAIGTGGVLVAADTFRVCAQVREGLQLVAQLMPNDDRKAADVCIDLLPGFDELWRGQNVDVRNVAVPGGRLSFSIRWHGPRPAVLWDIVASSATKGASNDGTTIPPGSMTASLTARSIDPKWFVKSPKGEDLLLR
jgi:hypothetical protein